MNNATTKNTKNSKECGKDFPSSLSCAFVPFVAKVFKDKTTTKYTKNTKEEKGQFQNSFSCPFVPFVAEYSVCLNMEKIV